MEKIFDASFYREIWIVSIPMYILPTLKQMRLYT